MPVLDDIINQQIVIEVLDKIIKRPSLPLDT